MSASDILTELLSGVPDSYQKTVGFPVYDILAAVAGRMADTDAHNDAALATLDPLTLTGGALDSYWYPRTGLTRHQATFATGAVTCMGNGTVQAGDLFESAGGLQYAATAQTVIETTGSVAVECVTPGAAGNLPLGSVTMMPVQIAGITAVSNAAPMTGGYDEESDAAYLARCLTALRTPSTSGNKYQYWTWAMSCTGVGGCEVVPLGHGANTVDVVLIDSNGQPAGTDLVAAVQAYIDPGSSGTGEGQAGIGAHCYVSAATALQLTVTMTLTISDGSSQSTVQQTVEQAVRTYLTSIAFAQDYVGYGKLAAAIMDVPGVINYENLTVNNGTSNVAVPARSVAVLQEAVITFA